MTSGGSLVVVCPCVPLAFDLFTREMWSLQWLAGVGITKQEVVTSSVIETVAHFLSEGGGTAVAKYEYIGKSKYYSKSFSIYW